MPPKKKVKEAEAPQQVQPESQQVPKIPKKPFYRSVLLDYDKQDEQEKHIQIKLWKINSFKNTHQWSCFPSTLSKLSNKQRVFKNLRKLDVFLSWPERANIKKVMLKSWRLERFVLSDIGSQLAWMKEFVLSEMSQRAWMKKLVKRRLNPHLKDLFFKMYYPSQKDIEKSIDEWKYLVNCNIWFQDHKKSPPPKLVLNSKKIQSLGRFLKGSNKNQVIESVETIFQNLFSKEREKEFSREKKENIFDLSSMDASQLPNLKTLLVHHSTEEPHPTLDFIKNYPQITSLVIWDDCQNAHLFEFLNSLQNLKQLTIHPPQRWRDKEISKTLPIIHSLERLNISCSPEKFSSENIQEFLTSNKHLKSLEVHFPLQDDYLIFHENLILPIETLNLSLGYNKISQMITKKLAAFLGKNKQLRSLEIYLCSSFPLEHSEILQKGIASMTCLESLIWHCRMPSELQDIQLKGFKKIFSLSPGIQKLELDFGGGVLMSRSSSSFIDGLFSMKNLKYFALRVAFVKISPATVGKLLQLLRFLIFENVATVKLDLQGFTEEITEEINALLAKQYHLYYDKSKKDHYFGGPKW